MFEDILRRSERLPSAREQTKRNNYLDIVLGKLPEISSQRSTASRNGKCIKGAISDRKSDASTAYKTELSVQTKALIEDVDADKPKVEEEEGDYFQWHEKQLECLKLPIAKTLPKSQRRPFTTGRKSAQTAFSEYSDESSDYSITQHSMMNKTTFPILQNTPKDKKEGEEEEKTPLEIHRQTYYDEKAARKGRWILKVEKEDDRTAHEASIASMNASSCNDAINKTFTAPDAYNQYKTQQTKLNNAMLSNYAAIEKKEAEKPIRGRRMVAAQLALKAAQKPKMTTKEYQAWRAEKQTNRFGVSSIPRWRGGNVALDTSKGFESKTVKSQRPENRMAKTPNRTPNKYAFAPKNVREMIQKNREKIVERVKLLQIMKEEE